MPPDEHTLAPVEFWAPFKPDNDLNPFGDYTSLVCRGEATEVGYRKTFSLRSTRYVELSRTLTDSETRRALESLFFQTATPGSST